MIFFVLLICIFRSQILLHLRLETQFLRNLLLNFQMTKIFILFTVMIVSLYAAVDIMQFGAVPHSDNVRDHFQNQKAIAQALIKANESLTDRVVRIPAKTFYTMPFKIENMHNITFEILGRLSASKNVKFWPRQTDTKRHWNFIQINNCTNIEISGGGKIDGRGYHWWMILFLDNKNYINDQDDRPHLINMVNCQYIKIHDIVMKNSPQFHLKMDHCHDAQIYNVNILVNTTAQINLLKKLSLEGLVIMFPFNTDGIDPSGGRMHIYNLTVQNWDDVVVPKPSRDYDCTRDMLIENIEVVLGVGLTVGSVPPQIGGSCVRNITFRNVVQKRPLKGIYVKTNPGDKGYGNITDIYYRNFTMDRPIWWAIYIGPQQMKEPDGDGPGCMLYPFDRKGTCETQPRVTLRNISLIDIQIHKSFFYPITIRCNVTNPCTQINFINVQVDEWQIGQTIQGYVCEFATGVGRNNKPPLYCLSDAGSDTYEQKIPQTRQKIDNQIDSESIEDYLQTIKGKSLKELYKEMTELTKTLSDKGKFMLKRLVQQIQSAAHEVGYHDSDDDQFMYDLAELESQFASNETLEDILAEPHTSIYNEATE